MDATPDVTEDVASPEDASRDSVFLDATPNLLGFESIRDYNAFDFFEPSDPNVPATWGFVPHGNPHLVQSSNVGPNSGPGIGARAIHRDIVLGDGSVSVRTWSSDDDYAGLIARYVDSTHFYRLRYKEQTGAPHVLLERIDGSTISVMDDDDFRPNHDEPGNVVRLEVDGGNLRGYINGILRVEATDPDPYPAGRVGLVTIFLSDAHFDDFTVEHYSEDAI